VNKDERIAMLEQKCQWAADQFEQISNAIADNSSAYAQTHAQSCAAEMDPDFDGNLQSPRVSNAQSILYFAQNNSVNAK
jgi:hypothetical protein